MAFLVGLAIGCGGVIGAMLFGPFKPVAKIVLIVLSLCALVWIISELVNNYV